MSNTKKENTLLFTFEGESKSLLEWSQLKGISVSTLLKRIHMLDWSFDKAISTPDVKKYFAHGRNLTLEQWSNFLKLPQSVLSERLEKGYESLNDVFVNNSKKPKLQNFRFFGKSLALDEWESLTGVPENVLLKRMYIYNMTFKGSISYPYVENKKVYEYNGEMKTLSDWSHLLGVSYSLLLKNVAVSGKSISYIVKKYCSTKRGKTTYLYLGKKYTLTDLSKLTGVKRSILRDRIVKRGWSVEKSVQKPVVSRKK